MITEFSKRTSLKMGLMLLLVLSLFSWVAPYFSPDPNQVNLLNDLAPPSFEHFLGTDELGRDLWARIWVGGRISLMIGWFSALLAVCLGMVIGILSAELGGKWDHFFMRVIDIFLSLPLIFLILTIQAIFPPKIENLIVMIGLSSWMGTARLIRARYLSLKNRKFILAKRAMGFSKKHIVIKEILPHLTGTLSVATSFAVGAAILMEASLSFSGVGVLLPTPSWGNLLQNAQDRVFDAQWQIFFPGLMIFLTVWCFYLIGDSIRDLYEGDNDVKRA